jgi:hypothetical protein
MQTIEVELFGCRGWRVSVSGEVSRACICHFCSCARDSAGKMCKASSSKGGYSGGPNKALGKLNVSGNAGSSSISISRSPKRLAFGLANNEPESDILEH